MANITKNCLPELSALMRNDNVMNNLKQMMGSKAQGFATSVLAVVNGSPQLQQCDHKSIYKAAMIAATLDLPVNQNLGFSALIPFKGECQFQIMVNGYKQLALRTGFYKDIDSRNVYDGQLVDVCPLTGRPKFDFTAKVSDTVIGYLAYCIYDDARGGEVIKTLYLSREDAEKHGKKYSQTYQRGYGLWKDQFDAMGQKTVLKMLIKKHCLMTTDDGNLRRAVQFDQSVVKGDIENVEDIDDVEVEYVDNHSSSASSKAADFLEIEK